MAHDLIVEARAFLPTGFSEVEIGINLETGKIEAVKRSLPGTPRKRFRGRLLFPSAVDLHVHFREPGHPHKEDFRSGTTGAARGGVGTILDMPNTDPIIDRASRLEEKRDRVAGKAVVDWGLWCTLTRQTPDVARLLQRSMGAKLFLVPTTGIEAPPTQDQLSAWFLECHRAERPVVVHAETIVHRAPATLAQHDLARPMGGEEEAVEHLARCATAGQRVHVAHASAAPTAEAARRAGFSAAATPHHLLLAFDEGNLGARGKVNPPLRSARNRNALWDAFTQGQIPILESDHAPHTLEEKDRPFPEAPAGVPGVETAFPLLLRRAKENAVSVDLVVRGYAQAPAEFLGLPKGRIEPGCDADFFLINPATVQRVKGSELASKCGWTPFEGWEQHAVETHYLHGEVVVEDYRFVGKPGQGRALEPRSVRTARAP